MITEPYLAALIAALTVLTVVLVAYTALGIRDRTMAELVVNVEKTKEYLEGGAVASGSAVLLEVVNKGATPAHIKYAFAKVEFNVTYTGGDWRVYSYKKELPSFTLYPGRKYVKVFDVLADNGINPMDVNTTRIIHVDFVVATDYNVYVFRSSSMLPDRVVYVDPGLLGETIKVVLPTGEASYFTPYEVEFCAVVPSQDVLNSNITLATYLSGAYTDGRDVYNISYNPTCVDLQCSHPEVTITIGSETLNNKVYDFCEVSGADSIPGADSYYVVFGKGLLVFASSLHSYDISSVLAGINESPIPSGDSDVQAARFEIVKVPFPDGAILEEALSLAAAEAVAQGNLFSVGSFSGQLVFVGWVAYGSATSTKKIEFYYPQFYPVVLVLSPQTPYPQG